MEEARRAASGRKPDEKRGQLIVDYLSGRPGPAAHASPRAVTGVRLVSVTRDSAEADTDERASSANRVYVDLIHETLIRMRGRDPATGKRLGYWRTLYDYIERNRDRSFYREQLARQAGEWQSSRGLGRWRRLAGWGDLLRYRRFHPARGEPEHSFKRASLWATGIHAGILAALLGYAGQAYWWTLHHGMPPGYMMTLQKFRLMQWGLLAKPHPEMSQEIIPLPEGDIRIGELDEKFGDMTVRVLTERGQLSISNFGYPNRIATIAQPFAIGRYEVTYEQYDYYVWSSRGTNGAPEYPNGAPGDNARGQRPVTNVSWNDANAYLVWLSARTGEHYRLPTEAEWEYSARAGTTSAYWWSEEIGNDKANCDGCGSQWDNRTVAPVGSFKANPWGLHDTAGNVWEWTCSEWQTQLDASASACVDPDETAGGRAIRGGSWINWTDWLRSSARNWDDTDSRVSNLGFRVLRAARTD